jgi:exo-1,4-beta-D-glucosaminidase
MAQAPVSATATSSQSGDTTTTTVVLRNTSTGKTPAFYVDAHVVDSAGKPVLPVQWSDNEVSLWPGEQTTVTASYRTSDLHGSAPSVRVSGWNVATQTVPAGSGGGPDTQPPSVPANVHTTSVAANSVGLAWDASTDNVGVTGYDVYRDGAPLTTSTGAAATDSTAAPSTTYSYTVRARDAAGNTSGFSTPVSVTTPAGGGSNKYEAENATISQGTVANNHLNFSGTGFVDYTNVNGSYVEWTVSAASAGNATLTFRVANGTTVNRPMDISVNGVTVAAGVAFGPTANWDTWVDVNVTVPLNAGTNTVRATATTANGGPNVDYLSVH